MKNLLHTLIIFILNLLAVFTIHCTVTLIDTGGLVPVCASVIADPLIPNDTIITISSSNVILEMNENVLTQSATNSMTGLIGIYIAPNLTNITIRNGTIRDINGIGIYVSDGCAEIYLDNVSIIGCQKTGVLFDGNITGSSIFNTIISDCLIASCTGESGSPAYGLRMIGAKNANITNCIINNNLTSQANNGYGISIESCTSCKFDICKSYNNGGTTIGAGVSLLNSNGCSFYDCSSYSNVLTALNNTGTSCGYLITSCTAILFSSCNATGNANLLGTGIGFNSSNNLNLLFKNCLAGSNKGGTLGAGFYFGGNDLNFGISNNLCSANASNSRAYGIFLNGAQGFNIRNNTLASNVGTLGYGLLDSTIDTNNLFINNLSYNNTTTGYQISFTDGEFPVIFASNNDFSSLTNISQYFNVAMVPG